VDPSELFAPSVRVVLAGGKGGVGKTTTAAAVALSAAARWPRRRVLLISTDPAHSLGDVFGVGLSDQAQSLPVGPENLRVRELDAAVVINRLKGRFKQAIEGVFDRLGGGGKFDAAHDRSIMQSLIDLAPPGLDELAAVLEVTDAITVGEPEWDLVVMDTAPTGHALRLLEMPGLMQAWVRALMSILLKYQVVAGLGELGALLLHLSKGLGRLRELLADPTQTAFLIVTRPAALPRLETQRFARRLKRLRIPVAAIVVSAVGRGTCSRCVRILRAQRREVVATRALAAALKVQPVVVTDARVPPPLNVPDLEEWSMTGWQSPS
jgi:arsenite-transporting ATPase